MYRFHDFNSTLVADFWKNYYEDPELIELFAFANNAIGASISYQLLQMYDLQGIPDHLPGRLTAWEKITLSGPYAGSSKYPFRYYLSPDVLYIDTLHEKMVDPKYFYQNGIDFVFYKGRLDFGKPPASLTLFAPKISRIGTRLNDDFGRLFGYSRYDSYYYRDTMVPLMELMYKGPTYPLIKTAGNVMVGNPIAKYGDETVVEVTDEWVRTDKYLYPNGAAAPSVKVGDKLSRNQPLADVVELYTHKTHPNWWVNRAPELFYKYTETPMSCEQRDRMMDLYLKSFVANLQVKYNRVDWSKFELQRDVFDLILDGMPVRSDLILSGAYEVYESGWQPDTDALRSVPHNFCVWGNRLIEGAEGFIHAPSKFFPRIGDDTWEIGTERFFFIDEGHEFDEFWSEHPELYPYVEPYLSTTSYDDTVTRSFLSKRVTELELTTPIDKERGLVTGMKSILVSSCSPSDIQCSSKDIQASQMIEKVLLSTWDMNGVHMGVDGLVCDADSSGEAISPDLELGLFDKDIYVAVFKTLPSGTSVSLFYQVNDTAWVPLPDTGVIERAHGLVRFKAVLTASKYEWPVFKGVNVAISLSA